MKRSRGERTGQVPYGFALAADSVHLEEHAAEQAIIGQIQEEERLPDLENYLLDVFDHFGVHIEELAPQTWQLNPQGIITDSFPSMPAEGMIATCDRRRALSREDVGFLT